MSQFDRPMFVMPLAEVEDRFTYHAPTDPAVRARHDFIRALFLDLATTLNSHLPPGRSAALAFTALEESAMHCHAAIARDHHWCISHPLPGSNPET